MTELASLTVAELKVKLKERGLPVTGVKAVLLQRLQDGHATATTATTAATTETTGNKKEEKTKIAKLKSEPKAAYDIDDLEALMLEGESFLSAAPTRSPSTSSRSSSSSFPSSSSSAATSVDEIQALIDERHEHRMVRDFDKADAIVDQLRSQYGVEVQSSRGVWIASDGTKGPLSRNGDGSSDKLTGSPRVPLKVLGPNDPCRLTKEEIQKLVNERTMARRKRFFNEADKIRDSLADEGVELLDSEDEWRCTNGRLSGSQSSLDDRRGRGYR